MSRSPRFIAAPWLAALAVGSALQGCGVGCGGSTGDMCAGPPIGFAQVDARVLDASAKPIPDVAVWLSCGSVAGADHRRTDATGRTSFPLVHGEADSTLFPLPPRDATGGFFVSCLVWADLRDDISGNPRLDSVAVYFAGPEASIVPTGIELRAE